MRISTILPRWRSVRAQWFPLLACLLGLWIVSASKNIAVLNQGDFTHAFEGLLMNPPLDKPDYNGWVAPAFIWPYSPSITRPLKERNPLWIYFWLNAKFQRIYSLYFDLFLMAVFSKVIWLLCAYRLSASCLKRTDLPSSLRPVLFVLLVLAFSYAHNIAFLNSFYGEHVFFVFMPVALVGLLEDPPWVRLALVSIGLLFCGGAKPQYFYIPALAACVLCLMPILNRHKPEWRLILTLVGILGACAFFAFTNPMKPNNYYNSTYFGSYLLLSTQQVKQLGVTDANLECVGTDPWAIRVDPHDSTKFTHGPSNCVGRAVVTLTDVLAPYLHNPGLLLDMWRWLAPVHFTVKYFHLGRDTPYLMPADGKSFHSGHTLIRLSDLREKLITPHYVALLVFGLVLSFVSYRHTVGLDLRIATLFLALFIPSQFVISILGEGIRDLSKHLAAAQLCLDFLSVLILMQLAAYAHLGWKAFVARSARLTIATQPSENQVAL